METDMNQNEYDPTLAETMEEYDSMNYQYEDQVITTGIGAQIRAAKLPTNQPRENTMEQDELELYTRGLAIMDSIFMFGKHKHKKFSEVLAKHEGYIRWLSENEVIEFDEECLEAMSAVGIA